MLGLADDMRSLAGQGGGVRGHCRFGVGELAALTWLPDLVAHARAAWPDLQVEAAEGGQGRYLLWVSIE